MDESVCWGATAGSSHYDALGVPEDASYSHIRSSYRAAILSLHPDKITLHTRLQHFAQDADVFVARDSLRNDPESFPCELDDANCDSGDFGGDDKRSRFSRVQDAWQVLRHAESRASYDAFLAARRATLNEPVVIGDVVDLEEMDVSLLDCEGESEFSYLCRCGDYFVIDEKALKKLGLVAVQASDAILSGQSNIESENEGLSISSGFSLSQENLGQQYAFEKPVQGPTTGDEERIHTLAKERMHFQGSVASKVLIKTTTQTCRELKSVLVPCGSCSLHLQVQFWALSSGNQ
ncbi:hypothetical protein O6H91_11G022800 [Diphasiastrum complanatum]|uniref:Uncharacterized protein n=1 Tax=Diphasiastrum complanatum TaxID=34168 RepID=A0ACC2C719_DIPCM|nr:hypothetical protein O6H91_11G022800 [Diphasiastrum complanatum]